MASAAMAAGTTREETATMRFLSCFLSLTCDCGQVVAHPNVSLRFNAVLQQESSSGLPNSDAPLARSLVLKPTTHYGVPSGCLVDAVTHSQVLRSSSPELDVVAVLGERRKDGTRLLPRAKCC